MEKSKLEKKAKTLEFNVQAIDYIGERKTDYLTYLDGNYIALGAGYLFSLDYVAKLIISHASGKGDKNITIISKKESLKSDFGYFGLSLAKFASSRLKRDTTKFNFLKNILGIERSLSTNEMRSLIEKILDKSEDYNK